MSAAARKRISRAQKAGWAKFKAKKNPQSPEGSGLRVRSLLHFPTLITFLSIKLILPNIRYDFPVSGPFRKAFIATLYVTDREIVRFTASRTFASDMFVAFAISAVRNLPRWLFRRNIIAGPRFRDSKSAWTFCRLRFSASSMLSSLPPCYPRLARPFVRFMLTFLLFLCDSVGLVVFGAPDDAPFLSLPLSERFELPRVIEKICRSHDKDIRSTGHRVERVAPTVYRIETRSPTFGLRLRVGLIVRLQAQPRTLNSSPLPSQTQKPLPERCLLHLQTRSCKPRLS